MTETSLMFDIETTGFSKDRTSLYLIGTGRIIGHDFEITQFFADSKSDEKAVLEAFIEFLKENNIDTLISFNGLMFDMPYLSHKMGIYGLPDTLKDMAHTDIYKLVRSMKPLFKLSSYKQKSIEDFLGIHRDDEFSGGQLIPIYEAYCKSQDEELLAPLLLHNYEDVLGMLDLLPVLSYFYNINGTSFMAPSSSELTEDRLEMLFSLEYQVPRTLFLEDENLTLTFKKDTAELVIPIVCNECRLFFEDYKKYYYFPEEDIAYHESVAMFTDKSHRIRATKDTAYSRERGLFIPSFGLESDRIYRKTSLRDEPLIRIEKSTLQDTEWMKVFMWQVKEYIRHIK